MHLCPATHPIRACSGVAGANESAATICFQITGPCPVPTAGTPAAAYVAGSVALVSAMKNMDHFNAAAPGNFSAYLWDAKGTSTLVGAYPDTAAPSLTVYQLPITIPAGTPSGDYVLQTIYFTDNTAAPPAFFQCSDVTVL